MRAQVKIRGMRVEQGEIEDALRACKGVEGAAVRVLQHPNTHQTCIVGYLNPAGGALECALSPEEDLTHLTYLGEGPPTFLSLSDGNLRYWRSLGLLEGTIASCFPH